MTMPTFEPVAWQATRNGFICKENKNPEYNIGLFTESQLQQAYEAGKREAVPELKEREKELDKAKESVGIYYDAWQKELTHETMATSRP